MAAINFCKLCDSVMAKEYPAVGPPIYVCRCGEIVPGNEKSTLMFREYPNSEKVSQRDVMLDNSVNDPARFIAMKDCPSCEINFLTKVRQGESMTAVYLCDCGFRATHSEYMKTMQGK